MRHYYVEIEDNGVGDPPTAENLADTLRAVGHGVEVVRETARPQNGMIHTEAALEDIWRTESGAEFCKRPVGGMVRSHREWADLTDEQREHFVAVMSEWMAEARYTEFYLQDEARRDLFDSVALHCDDHQRSGLRRVR